MHYVQSTTTDNLVATQLNFSHISQSRKVLISITVPVWPNWDEVYGTLGRTYFEAVLLVGQYLEVTVCL